MYEMHYCMEAKRGPSVWATEDGLKLSILLKISRVNKVKKQKLFKTFKGGHSYGMR